MITPTLIGLTDGLLIYRCQRRWIPAVLFCPLVFPLLKSTDAPIGSTDASSFVLVGAFLLLLLFPPSLRNSTDACTSVEPMLEGLSALLCLSLGILKWDSFVCVSAVFC